MTVSSLLTELRRLDVQLWMDGDQLRCNAPAGVLTADLRDVLRQRKADVIEFLRSAETVARQERGIVPLQPRGAQAPIFAVPGHNGDVFLYRALARELGANQPFFGLQPPGVEDGANPFTTVEDLAQYFAKQIRVFRPQGPYVLAGYCAGATIAYEVAQQLIRDGAQVNFIAMFAGAFPDSYHRLPQMIEHLTLRARRARKHVRAIVSQSLAQTRDYIKTRLHAIAEVRRSASDEILERRAQLMRVTAAAVAQYKPQSIATRVCLVFPSDGCVPQKSMLKWRGVTSTVEEYFGPAGCEGDVMLLENYAAATADLFRQCRER